MIEKEIKEYYCVDCQSLQECVSTESQIKCLKCNKFNVYVPMKKNIDNPNICYCKSCDKQCMLKTENPITKSDDFFCVSCGIFQAEDKKEDTFDVVQKPYHYNVGIEVYAYIKSLKMGYEAGNIIKYVTRYPYKDSKKRVQDLEKAKWYLERLIELEKEKEEERNNDSK